MNNKVFTMEEIQTLKFCELPNAIYNSIRREIEQMFGTLSENLMPIFDKANVYEIDQFIDVYKYMIII